ncbi:hypothetical protein CEP53_014223 [Fusarium sp. AF-6]|nr:hypothetical protein CEP53_014223 [Fusarium sp. AF-6]
MPESLGVCSTVLRALYSPSRLPPIDFATRNPFRHRDTLVLVYRRRLAYFFSERILFDALPCLRAVSALVLSPTSSGVTNLARREPHTSPPTSRTGHLINP